jgi:hypothetical protein
MPRYPHPIPLSSGEGLAAEAATSLRSEVPPLFISHFAFRILRNEKCISDNRWTYTRLNNNQVYVQEIMNAIDTVKVIIAEIEMTFASNSYKICYVRFLVLFSWRYISFFS